MTRLAVLVSAVSALAMIPAAHASEWPHERPVRMFAEDHVRVWISDPDLIDSIRAQNESHTKLTKADIDSLDQQWRAERGRSDRPLIDEVLMGLIAALLASLRKPKEPTGEEPGPPADG